LKLSAKLVGITQPTIELLEASPEGLVAYCARVSNPQHQDKELGSLLSYCIRNRHWSIFEMADAVVEIEAPRDISRQLLRHRSFSFQEFSQRYSDVCLEVLEGKHFPKTGYRAFTHYVVCSEVVG